MIQKKREVIQISQWNRAPNEFRSLPNLTEPIQKTHNNQRSSDNPAWFPKEYLHQLGKLKLPRGSNLVFRFQQPGL